jgi:4-amino-4-deoxy-L-arabinose transferase-like glycosyltransferase
MAALARPGRPAPHVPATCRGLAGGRAGLRELARRARVDALLAGYVVLLVVMAGALLLVPPGGEFSVDDDWIYAQTVRRLMTDGVYQPSVWIDTAFLAQAWWGAAVSWLFGFSQTSLRLATLLLAAVALALYYALLCRSLRPGLALSATLLLLFHPLMLHLAYTFMTEIPFLAVMLAAIWCVSIATESGGRTRPAWLAAGSALIGLACLIRQIGIVLVPAILIGALPELRSARVSRARLLAALALPFSLVVALLYAEPRDVSVGGRLLDVLRTSEPADLLWGP